MQSQSLPFYHSYIPYTHYTHTHTYIYIYQCLIHALNLHFLAQDLPEENSLLDVLAVLFPPRESDLEKLFGEYGVLTNVTIIQDKIVSF